MHTAHLPSRPCTMRVAVFLRLGPPCTAASSLQRLLSEAVHMAGARRQLAARPVRLCALRETETPYLEQLEYSEEVLAERATKDELNFRDRLDLIKVLLYQHRGREADAVALVISLLYDCATNPDVQYSNENSVYAFKIGVIALLLEGLRHGPEQNKEEIELFMEVVDLIEHDLCSVNPTGVVMYGPQRALQEAVSYFEEKLGARNLVTYPDPRAELPDGQLAKEGLVKASNVFNYNFFNDDRLSDVKFDGTPARLPVPVFDRELAGLTQRMTSTVKSGVLSDDYDY